MESGPFRRPGARRPPAVLLLAAGALILGAGVLVLILASQSAGGGVATSPQIVVDRTEIDFGQIPVNQRVKADFTITNEGGRPLQLVGRPQVDVVKGC